MSWQLVASGVVAAAFAAIHLAGRLFDFLGGKPRSVWLSAAGGISVAYVFVHIIPELASHQDAVIGRFEREDVGVFVERLVYVAALGGLAAFYGLDALLRKSDRDGGGHTDGVFWTHLGSFALYNLLVGYLLVHREEESATSLALFAFALGLHFIINDQALREHHGQLYHARGRWLLAAAPVGGWIAGISTRINQVWLSILFAILAGSIVLNVLKEELPEDRESRFSAFLLGAALYAALMLLAE